MPFNFKYIQITLIFHKFSSFSLSILLVSHLLIESWAVAYLRGGGGGGGRGGRSAPGGTIWGAAKKGEGRRKEEGKIERKKREREREERERERDAQVTLYGHFKKKSENQNFL